MDARKYKANEILSQAIMTKRPIAIVEGVDDIQVYDDVSKASGIKIKVLPVECIEGANQGCDGVIELMDKILSLQTSKYDYKKYVVGIIDKDVRDYRKNIPENELVFPLKYYSMESHFVCEQRILDLVKQFTKTTDELRTNTLHTHLVGEVNKALNSLYLYSLESLKGAIDSNYTSDFSYSCSAGRIGRDTALEQRIQAKKDELLSFAVENQVSCDLESMRKFVKGKWLIDLFSQELVRAITSLNGKCGEGQLKKCELCITEIENKCSYKIKEGVNHTHIKLSMMSNLDSPNFEYLKNKFRTLVQ